MRSLGLSRPLDGRARRGWFAETLVVLGILAFAYFALTIQPTSNEPAAAPAAPTVLDTMALG